jgi:hypothetical protein
LPFDYNFRINLAMSHCQAPVVPRGTTSASRSLPTYAAATVSLWTSNPTNNVLSCAMADLLEGIINDAQFIMRLWSHKDLPTIGSGGQLSMAEVILPRRHNAPAKKSSASETNMFIFIRAITYAAL